MANLRNKMKKLQTAIIKAGVPVKVNQIQFYSNEEKRMITQYNILILNKGKYKEILKTCSMVEVIRCLLEEYKKVST